MHNDRWYEEKQGSSGLINSPDLVDIVVAGGQPPTEDDDDDPDDTKRKNVFNNPLFEKEDGDHKEDPNTVIPHGLVSAIVRRVSERDKSGPPKSETKFPLTLQRASSGVHLLGRGGRGKGLDVSPFFMPLFAYTKVCYPSKHFTPLPNLRSETHIALWAFYRWTWVLIQGRHI